MIGREGAGKFTLYPGGAEREDMQSRSKLTSGKSLKTIGSGDTGGELKRWGMTTI